MDIRELEKAVRSLVKGESPQPTLIALAGSGQLPIEFESAVRSLIGRKHPGGTENAEQTKTQYWI